jgi:hypothetical protein
VERKYRDTVSLKKSSYGKTKSKPNLENLDPNLILPNTPVTSHDTATISLLIAIIIFIFTGIISVKTVG